MFVDIRFGPTEDPLLIVRGFDGYRAADVVRTGAAGAKRETIRRMTNPPDDAPAQQTAH